jgi:hypothetical protein
MRNWLRSSGVYTNMLRVPLFLLCSLAALAQPSPPQNPMDAAIQAVWQVRDSGRTEEVAPLREQAHALLRRVPADSQQFANWAQQVAHLDALGWSWRQDGNLLKAVGYLEQTAAARPATPSAVYSYTNLPAYIGNSAGPMP